MIATSMAPSRRRQTTPPAALTSAESGSTFTRATVHRISAVLRLQVPIAGPAATLALDQLLAVAPLGVHERPGELVVHARALPPVDEMRAALGVADLTVQEVPEVAAE